MNILGNIYSETNTERKVMIWNWFWPVRTGITFFDVWTIFHLAFWVFMGSNFWVQRCLRVGNLRAVRGEKMAYSLAKPRIPAEQLHL
jgi:hypothetical protein